MCTKKFSNGFATRQLLLRYSNSCIHAMSASYLLLRGQEKTTKEKPNNYAGEQNKCSF